MSKPQFILVAGPNGAGKSTLTRSIKHRFSDVDFIDADIIARDLSGSFSNIETKRFAAGKYALKRLKHHIQSRQPIILESTISSLSYLKYAKLASLAGFRTVFIYIAVKNAAISQARVASRVNLGGHAITERDIHYRYPRSMSNIKPFLNHFDDAFIYDNSDQYRWLAAYCGGELNSSVDNIPDWLYSKIL